MTAPIISVVIPTFNREGLLREALESFARQRMPKATFEVIVVDNGSTDGTEAVCSALSSQLQLRYVRLGPVGTAAAKNMGIFMSTGVLTLFFDDDDIAEPDLLWEHVLAHQKHPQEYVAVLGYTTWAPSLHVSELMHYLTDVGQHLFAYQSLHDGEFLEFDHFWTGRISCKRAFLTSNGVFNQDLVVYEDVELGYRLSRVGLKILFQRSAVSYMNRAITYDMFCRRCEGQGRALWTLSQVHADPLIQRYCDVAEIERRWHKAGVDLDDKVRRVHELQGSLVTLEAVEDIVRAQDELHNLYRATFGAFKIKGAYEAAGELATLELVTGGRA